MTVIRTATLLALALSLPAEAQQSDREGQATGSETVEETRGARVDAAWNVARAMQGGMLAPGQTARFMLLAWHAAAANLCEDLALDHTAFGVAWADLEHADMASLSDEEHRYFQHHLAVNFGVAVGIMLAEHAGTPQEIADFCHSALAYADDDSHPSFFAADLAEAPAD